MLGMTLEGKRKFLSVSRTVQSVAFALWIAGAPSRDVHSRTPAEILGSLCTSSISLLAQSFVSRSWRVLRNRDEELVVGSSGQWLSTNYYGNISVFLTNMAYQYTPVKYHPSFKTTWDKIGVFFETIVFIMWYRLLVAIKTIWTQIVCTVGALIIFHYILNWSWPWFHFLNAAFPEHSTQCQKIIKF